VVVVTEEQLAGRGRRGRTWTSPPGLNLMLSVALRPRLGVDDAWQLGQAVALATREACLPVAPVDLKWPNDIVSADGRKVGGILLETALDGSRLVAAVIGIGLNVNWAQAGMPPEIAATATSLAHLARAPVDRIALLDRLLAALDAEVAAVEAGRSPLERYRAACSTIGAEVVVEVGEGTIEGRATGIDAGGALVVVTADGARSLTTGEVTRVRRAVPA
jgi:BirA family biotin operon repressor/biotin-[acetyl-CoA-carboxylase] ligase